jgi:hypothetical protein
MLKEENNKKEDLTHILYKCEFAMTQYHFVRWNKLEYFRVSVEREKAGVGFEHRSDLCTDFFYTPDNLSLSSYSFCAETPHMTT